MAAKSARPRSLSASDQSLFSRSMVRQVSFSVAETFDRLDEHSGLYRSADTVFRPVEGRDLGMYDCLEDVFWRETKAGFTLPDTELVQDVAGDYWAGVEYIDGSRPLDKLDINSDEADLDGFLSSYAESQLGVIDNPDQPFVHDVCLEQFLGDGQEWYVVDVEPRLTYLTDRVSDSNKAYLSNVANTVAMHDRFTRLHHSLPKTTAVLDELVHSLTQEDEESRWTQPSVIPEYGSIRRYKSRKEL